MLEEKSIANTKRQAMEISMPFKVIGLIELSSRSGLGLMLLIIGALFTASVVVLITSFYLDVYWEDEDYRKMLRFGKKGAKRRFG